MDNDSPSKVSRRKFLGASAASVTLASAAKAAGKSKAAGGGAFPGGLRVGRGDGRVPDRRRRRRRRPRRVGVGRVLQEEGRDVRGAHGRVACDHYHRFKEDVALMKTLGVKSYRFSVSWPRVLPEGVGKVNDKGVDFYNRLLDELGKAGITPMVHALPLGLPAGAVQARRLAEPRFGRLVRRYTAVLADKFSDRVKLWVTHNEPQCFIGMGHLDGVHAPGDKLKFGDYLVAAHNAHARPRQVGAGAARARQGPEGDEDRLRAGDAGRAAGERQARRRRGGARGDLRGQRPAPVEQHVVDRSGAARQVPGRRRRRIRQGHAEVQAVRPGRDEAADRLPGPQHLQGRHRTARAPTASRRRFRTRPGYPRSGVGLAAADAELAVLGAALLPRALQAAGVAHRKRPGDARPGLPGRQGARPGSASTSCTATCPSSGARSRTACRSPATTRGRCSTTSSGPTATSSASA